LIYFKNLDRTSVNLKNLNIPLKKLNKN